MRLLTIEASADDEPDDTSRDLSGGTTGSTPIGFTPRWEPISEVEGVER